MFNGTRVIQHSLYFPLPSPWEPLGALTLSGHNATNPLASADV